MEKAEMDLIMVEYELGKIQDTILRYRNQISSGKISKFICKSVIILLTQQLAEILSRLTDA